MEHTSAPSPALTHAPSFAPTQRSTFVYKIALCHARLGLLAADALMRTSHDPVQKADARTSRDDFRAALDQLRELTPPIRRRKRT